MTYLFMFIIIGVSFFGAIRAGLYLWDKFKETSRKQAAADNAHKVRAANVCEHQWEPWSLPSPDTGIQQRHCLICNHLDTRRAA